MFDTNNEVKAVHGLISANEKLAREKSWVPFGSLRFGEIGIYLKN
jgi:hypothetical protein